MNIIEMKNVFFSAQERRIIQGANINFRPKNITAIVGPSGSGKSTVLKLAAGLLVPDQGDIYYKGKNIAYMNRGENLEYRRESAFVFQDSALWANQNLYQILELPLKIHYPRMEKKERSDRIREVTSQVGYTKDLDIRPSRLSMGEQKLIAFARALLCEPNLLYLDEWVESLDETAGDRLIDIVRKKHKEGMTVLFVCHDMRIIKDLADYIVVIVDGKAVHQSSKDQVLNDPELSYYLRVGIAS